jgi:hypothetical protein
LKTDINVPKESNKQKQSRKKHIFVGFLKVTDEKSRSGIMGTTVAYLMVPITASGVV